MIWFTSDLHFGHENIIRYTNRPYHSVDNMNKLLIMNWNERVGPDDEVYVIGDVALGKLRETVPLCLQLNGKKYLVPGNHDGCTPGHRKFGRAMIDLYQASGFEILPEQVLKVYMAQLTQFPHHASTTFLLCHYPYAKGAVEKHGKDEQTDARTPKPGDYWLLHGHTHQPERVTGPKSIHVGVDAWGQRPVSMEEIMAIVNAA